MTSSQNERHIFNIVLFNKLNKSLNSSNKVLSRFQCAQTEYIFVNTLQSVTIKHI